MPIMALHPLITLNSIEEFIKGFKLWVSTSAHFPKINQLRVELGGANFDVIYQNESWLRPDMSQLTSRLALHFSGPQTLEFRLWYNTWAKLVCTAIDQINRVSSDSSLDLGGHPNAVRDFPLLSQSGLDILVEGWWAIHKPSTHRPFIVPLGLLPFL